jgi:hypothetical protein
MSRREIALETPWWAGERKKTRRANRGRVEN